MQTINSRDLCLADLQTQFNLQVSRDPKFFPEWDIPPKITAQEQEGLNRVSRNFTDLVERRAISEQTVKLVVIAPLLDWAGFYRHPFTITAEEPIEIFGVDGNSKIKGKLDILVIKNKLWILIIESKSSSFNPRVGLPQLLSYMLAGLKNREIDLPIYGLLTNGQQFQFVKLVSSPCPTYGLSRIMSIDFPPDDFPKVLTIVRCLTQGECVSE